MKKKANSYPNTLLNDYLTMLIRELYYGITTVIIQQLSTYFMTEQASPPEGQSTGERILSEVQDLYKCVVDGALGPDIRIPFTDREIPTISITIPTLGLLSEKIGDMTAGGVEGKWKGLIAGSIFGLSIPFIQWYGSEIAPALSDEMIKTSDFIFNLPKTVINKFRSDK